MGIRDWFSRRTNNTAVTMTSEQTPASVLAVAADNSKIDVTQTFNDRNITFTGDLTGFDSMKILRDKQTNINSLYQLADFWVDADPLFRGAIKEVYVPFSLVDNYRLVGGTKQARQKYRDYFKSININEKLSSFFYQAYTYANFYVSVQPDGDIITLPPHLCRISNIKVNGRPLVEFNCRSVRDDLKRMGQRAYKKFIDDDKLEERLSGYPPEVALGLRNNADWVQLNPATTFIWQDTKPDWQRYAIPMVAACLRAFGKKELISNWEDSMLNLAARAFIHVTYGSPDHQVIPDAVALGKLQDLFARAMTASNKVALAVTNNFADSKVVQPESDHLFDHDKYASVNSDILSAVGISGIVVSGMDNVQSFGSSQVSTKMIALRIQEVKRRMCDLINEIINVGLNGTDNGLPRSNQEKLPTFTFPKTDLTNNAAFQDKCQELWEKGVLSYQTMLDELGFDYVEEKERKAQETKEEVQTKVFVKPGENPDEADTSTDDSGDGDGKIGRPTMDDDERNSDPGNSETGRNPKPSNESGSTPQSEQ